MKERPILFSGPVVRAILEGRKTMTRRAINPQPPEGTIGMYVEETIDFSAKTEWWYTEYLNNGRRWTDGGLTKCPYGTIGDRLWVKEAWCREVDPITSLPLDGAALYAATEDRHVIMDDGDGFAVINKDGTERSAWRSPIFMPRWASRITLEITNIRVERLQSIGEEDARAEGIEHLFTPEQVRERPELAEASNSWRNYMWHGDYGSHGRGNAFSDTWPHQFSSYNSAVGSFSSLWHKLNSKRYPWESNPWVWVIEFRRVP